MSKETEAAFDGWETEGLCDEAHNHFADFAKWDWCEISWEGCRLLGKLTNEEVHTESLTGQIMAAVSAQANHGAFASVAAMLGLDAKTLSLAVSEWSENQDNLPPPLTPEQFAEKYQETVQWLADLKNGLLTVTKDQADRG